MQHLGAAAEKLLVIPGGPGAPRTAYCALNFERRRHGRFFSTAGEKISACCAILIFCGMWLFGYTCCVKAVNCGVGFAKFGYEYSLAGERFCEGVCFGTHGSSLVPWD